MYIAVWTQMKDIRMKLPAGKFPPRKWLINARISKDARYLQYQRPAAANRCACKLCMLCCAVRACVCMCVHVLVCVRAVRVRARMFTCLAVWRRDACTKTLLQ